MTQDADVSTNWAALPDLLLLDEVCPITRHAVKTAYGLLNKGRFPIAHLPNVRPYRFRKQDVRAWVESGAITNEALAIAQRKPRRRRKAA